MAGVNDIRIVPLGHHIVFVFQFLLWAEPRYPARLEQPLDMLQRVEPLVRHAPALLQPLAEAAGGRLTDKIFPAKISGQIIPVKTQETGFYGLREDFSLFSVFLFL